MFPRVKRLIWTLEEVGRFWQNVPTQRYMGSSAHTSPRRQPDAGEIDLNKLLLQLADRGNEVDWEIFLSCYGSYLRLVISRALQDRPELVDDAFQEVVIAIQQSLPRYRSVSIAEAHGWIRTVAKRTAWQLNTRESGWQWRRHDLEKCLESVSVDRDDTDDCALDVEQILRELPEKHRRAIELYFMSGKTHRDVATEMGTTPDSVRKSIKRSLLGLRRRFAFLLSALCLSVLWSLEQVARLGTVACKMGSAAYRSKQAIAFITLGALGGGLMAVLVLRPEPSRQESTAVARTQTASERQWRIVQRIPLANNIGAEFNVTHHGHTLWMLVDNKVRSSRILVLDLLRDGASHRLPTKLPHMTGLAYGDGSLWSISGHAGKYRLLRIDPSTGQRLSHEKLIMPAGALLPMNFTLKYRDGQILIEDVYLKLNEGQCQRYVAICDSATAQCRLLQRSSDLVTTARSQLSAGQQSNWSDWSDGATRWPHFGCLYLHGRIEFATLAHSGSKFYRKRWRLTIDEQTQPLHAGNHIKACFHHDDGLVLVESDLKRSSAAILKLQPVY